MLQAVLIFWVQLVLVSFLKWLYYIFCYAVLQNFWAGFQINIGYFRISK